MKSTTVRELQHHLAKVLAWVERGEEVQVLRRNKVVAKLVAPGPRPVESPDFLARAERVWGRKPRGSQLSALVDEARGHR